MPDSREVLTDTTIFASTVGDKANFSDCIDHLLNQTVITPIEIIDRVAPMSAAFNEMHLRCHTEFYIQVDENMLLFPHAVQALRTSIASAREISGSVALRCGTVTHNGKIYRLRIAKQFPYSNTASCEIEQLARLRAAGYEILLQPRDFANCLVHSPETIFKRWQRCFQKQRLFGTLQWIKPYPPILLDRYVKTGEMLHLYAF
jgi:hypothetical protein